MNSVIQKMWDAFGIPFRLILFDQNWLPYFKWTTLEEERIRFVQPYIKGELLDIGAGKNSLVKLHGSGKGVDIHEWGGGAEVVEDTSKLNFRNESFDTVTFIACLNHIPYRDKVLSEACRVLKKHGVLIITMINPVLGNIGHAVWWHGEDRKRGGMKEGEVGGMWKKEIISLCTDAGFKIVEHKRFVYGMNNFYLFRKI